MSGFINTQKKFVVRGQNIRQKQALALRRSGSVETVHGYPKGADRYHQEHQNRFSQLESQYIRNLQQQIYFLELENSHLKGQLKKGLGMQPKLIAESDTLLEKLRRSKEEKHVAERELKNRDVQFDTLLQERSALIDRLRSAQELHSREKESLCQEVVELRKRLDDSEPEIAKMEAAFSKVQAELLETANKLCVVQKMADNWKEQLEMKSREASLHSHLESETQSEISQLAENMKHLEHKLIDQTAKNRLIVEESGNLKQKMRELELQARREKSVSEKVSEENNGIIKENAQLSAKLIQLESRLTGEEPEIPQKYDHVFSELAEARQEQKQLKQQLMKTQEQLRAETVKTNAANAQLSREQSGLVQIRDTNKRLEKQIDTLEVQLRNISAENQQLRKDKLSVDGKLEELGKTLSNKDIELISLRDRLQNVEQSYRELLQQYQQESVLQNEKCREFEQLAQKVKDLSRSIRHNHLLPNPFSPETSNPDET